MMQGKRRIAISLPATGEEEWQACREPLMSGWLTQGPKVAAFEKAFAARTRGCARLCGHLVHHRFASGARRARCRTGDEVIVPAFTPIATANVVLYCGATPVFADVARDTCNLDVASVAARITPRTRAVIAVHLFGRPVDMAELRRALPARVAIVEDAAGVRGRIGVERSPRGRTLERSPPSPSIRASR